MPEKKKKKKSWKERQRERQIRQQKAQEAYQIQREREAERKPRKWPKGKIVFGFCLIALIFGACGAWQYHNSLQPPAFGGTTGNPPPTGSAPNFSLRDINGTQFSLNQFSGKVIALHFMSVGCGGWPDQISDNQLKQLKSICNSYCGKKSVAILTVAYASCPSSNLVQLRANYDIKWIFGNDWDDGQLDIISPYVSSYGIKPGSIVIINKSFEVVEVYTELVAASTLSSKITQLLEA